MSEPESPDPTDVLASWVTSDERPEDLARKLSEQRLQSDQLRLLGSAVHVAGQGIAILTPAVEAEGPRIAFVNDGFCAIFGRRREEMIGQTVDIFNIVERQHSMLTAILDHVFDGLPFDAEITARRTDGNEFELDLQLIPVRGGAEVTHWVAFLRDITEEKRQVVMLRHQAMHDGLTDLPNRTLLFERLESSIRVARDSKSMLALLVMDLDRFKDVNDTFGHHFGDVLLKQVAFRLHNQLKTDDTIARLGGDEFAALLLDVPDTSAVARTARSILNTLEQPFVVEGQVLEVGASIGIALFPAHGLDARTLMRRADLAMYAAKQGQLGYTFHREEYDRRNPDDLSLVVEMRNAIDRNEFVLFYQPKLHLRSGLVTRAEVLLRWNHPTRGMVAPNSFVPIAERTGLIKPITDWLLDRALQQVRIWLDGGAPVHLAVNISARSLLEQTLPAKIQGLLDKWEVEPRFLKIEITESSIMADPAHALAILSMLQSMGIHLSVDDFGTGYSSLTHLRELPIDEIKIDKSFVMGMTTSDADAAIVRTVVDLAHNLGKQVCAEGVENQETWQMLKDMGCDLAQGYWISRPLSGPDLMQWLLDTSWGLARK